MKKTKHILLAVTSVVMAFIVAFAVGCDCKKTPSPDDEDVEKSLQSIELVTDNAKTTFITNQDDYSSDGLVIKAIYTAKDDGREITKNLTVSDTGVSIDSTAYKKSVEGTYTIWVFYTYERVLKSASYDVTVINARAGLDVRLKSSVDQVVGVGSDGKADLSDVANWIEVRQPDALGAIDENAAPLAVGSYAVEVYRNETKVEDLTSVSSGTYQVWASVDYPLVAGYKLEGFAIIYVNDKPVSISLAQSAVTAQTVSMTDSITSGLSFVVELSSGQSETVTSSTAGVTVSGIDTTVIGANKEATVVYAPGGIMGSVSSTFNYTINAPADGEGATITRNFKYTDLTSAINAVEGADGATDNLPLKAEYFTGSNAFINLVSTTKYEIYRTSNNCFQIGDDAIELLVQGNGTITVSFASTGSSNESRIGLKDADGNYVTASNTSATAVTGGDEAGSYSVTGTTATEVTWSGLEPGVYTLTSPTVTTTRGCRVSVIGVTDYIGNVEPPFDPTTQGTLHTSTFSYTELQNAIKVVENVSDLSTFIGNDATTPGDKIALKPEYFSSNNTNKFITLAITDNTANQYRSSNQCFEIQNDAITVTFTGVGYIEIEFSSTGSSNTSRCGVKGPDGKYLVAVSNGASTLVTAPDGDDDSVVGAYQVTGTGFVALKYEIKVAGTYTICCPYTEVQKRGARIRKLVLSDYYN